MKAQEKETKVTSPEREMDFNLMDENGDEEFDDFAEDDDTELAHSDEEDEAYEMMLVLETVFDMISDSFLEGVDSRSIEAMLFTNWIQVISLTCDVSEEALLKQLDKTATFMPKLLGKIKDIFENLPCDHSDSPQFDNALVVQMLTELREKGKNSDALSTEQVQLFLEEKTIELFEEFETMDANPFDVESAFLYYWLLLSAFKEDDANTIFKKISLHWGDIFEQMAVFSRQTMGFEPLE